MRASATSAVPAQGPPSRRRYTMPFWRQRLLATRLLGAHEVVAQAAGLLLREHDNLDGLLREALRTGARQHNAPRSSGAYNAQARPARGCAPAASAASMYRRGTRSAGARKGGRGGEKAVPRGREG